ncbi:tail protein [Lactobacillus phage Sabazios]|nr:tail protein [Lactobacillus phage Sabazios]
MTIRSYDINLDSFNATIPEPIIGRQGDKNGAVTLHVSITDRGMAVDLTGQTINLMAETAKGTAIVADNLGVTLTDTVNGKFDYAIPNALWSESGKITRAYFSLNDTDGQQTTYDLIFIVKKAIDISQDKADDYITIIDGTLRDLQTKIDAIYKEYQNGSFYSRNEIDSILSGYYKKAEIDAIKSEVVGDTNNQESLSGYFDNIIDEFGGPIPSYFVNKLNSMNSIDNSTFNVGFITDNHHQLSTYSPGSLTHYANIAALTRMVPINAVIAGGDNINGYFDRNQKFVETRQATSGLYGRVSHNTDVFFMLGNHDTGNGQNGNSTPATTITESELKSFYLSKEKAFNENRNGDSLYGFKDYEDQKIRVIWLNSFDLPWTLNTDGTYKYNFLTTSGYQGDQLEWLAKSALKLKSSDWHVMIFTHCPLPGTFEVAAGQSKLTQINSDVLISVINAFQQGKALTVTGTSSDLPVSFDVDFTGQGSGVVIGLFSGHIHRDGQMVSNGINCVETSCSLCHAGDAGRVAGTLTEDCWDVFSVNKSARTINAHRFGYGSDRTITY